MKGALEVSIGFIIIMVISALVLIFALSWLGGMWKQMTQISTYMTGQAVKQMTDSLRGGDDVILTTLPYSAEGVEIPVNSKTSFKIGVKRTAEAEAIATQGTSAEWDGFFSLCIGRLNDATCTPISGNAISIDINNIKFTYPKNLRINERGGVQMVDADMSIPTEYNAETYPIQGFRIFVCALQSAGGQCNGLSDPNLYGYTDFIVHIK